MANKCSTLGYFMKRMRDCGYRVERLFSDYCDSDSRAWTVIIDPERASVLCTCFINRNDLGESYFEFYDGGQYLPNYKIKTQSMEVLLETLNKYGIVGKTREYNEKGFIPENNSRESDENSR